MEEEKKNENGGGGSLRTDCELWFGTRDLYAILGLSHDDHLQSQTQSAHSSKFSQAQIKKAYYRASLKWHPDRGSSSDDTEEKRDHATRKFQTLARVYAILSDKDKRAVYDESGIIDDENIIENDDTDWVAKWRMLFKKVTVQDLDKFAQEYKGSVEEREDVKASYTRHKGDMSLILDDIMAASIQDESRFQDMIKQMIETNEVADWPLFSKETKARKTARKRKADKEAQEAGEAMRELKEKEGGGDLMAMIGRRQQNRQSQADSFLDQLQAKYAKPAKKAAKAKNK